MVQRGLRGGGAVRIAMQTQGQVDAKAAKQARDAERTAILAELDALDKQAGVKPETLTAIREALGIV